MTFFLTWLLCAVLVAIYANSRGRSGALAFIWSIIFSPLIVFIVYLFIGDGKVGRAQCPACAEYVKPQAIKCKHCNESLVATPPIPRKPIFSKTAKIWVAIIVVILVIWYAVRLATHTDVDIASTTQTYNMGIA